MKKFGRPFSSPSNKLFKYSSPQKRPAASESPLPPPPPPLKFDVIIAQVYGPTANIYKDIFEVPPTASQHELKEAYLRKRNQTQAKFAKLSNNNRKSILKSRERNNAKQKKHLVMQMNAISEAYQIIADEQKKKEYDASIGLKEQISDVSFDRNAGEFPGDELQNCRIEGSSVHHVDLSSRMEEYLKGKQTDERRIGADDYDVITTKANPNKKVQFTLESLGSPSPPPSPENVKQVRLVSPTGVAGFDKHNSPEDLTPLVEEDEELLVDVFASYLNLNNFMNVKECQDEENTNNIDPHIVGEDDWSSDETVKVSHCQTASGIFAFAEEMSKASTIITDALCQCQ
eukprot:CAMPEP_0201723324 /NCGR_PEP_ID=MMETSP0593-20130828/7414_1 /ASSEMBLY_ACC=CAM_ASM_000672 /TAXON_ID=267983 /ORGANISM="Skeletonema japonicum, Strain CCMP2506" /LENGTH=343 /DNA_ID=CAMNT_0048214419 /DNA_START=84 /DNA_END=1115 /DNA_ORIENTATION=+